MCAAASAKDNLFSSRYDIWKRKSKNLRLSVYKIIIWWSCHIIFHFGCVLCWPQNFGTLNGRLFLLSSVVRIIVANLLKPFLSPNLLTHSNQKGSSMLSVFLFRISTALWNCHWISQWSVANFVHDNMKVYLRNIN